MQTLRTPEDRFDGLVGYPYEPHYTQIPDGEGGSLRIHHVEDGPPAGPPVLLLHGEPSWSYLYRSMIPPLSAAGCRAIAPDFVGFGRSDKPARPSDYTYQRHVGWMLSWFDQVDLDGVTLFGQDWGGLIGLRALAERPDRFARAAVANSGLPTGRRRLGEAFERWREFSQTVESFQIGRLVNGGCQTSLPPEVIAAYDAPFPEESFKAGARAFPALVPATPDDPAAPANQAAWEVLSQWQKPFLTLFSDSDPITAGADRPFRERIPGAKGQPHATIEGAGHYLQEDKGDEVAARLASWILG